MRVSHVILRVTDMARSIAFYRDLVGLPLIMESAAFSFLDGGSIRIALNEESLVATDESRTEIVLEVDDVRSTFASLHGRGVPFEVELRPVTSDGARDLLASHFRDPDGHVVSVTGWE